MYKNIVFDIGGVIVDYDPKGYLSKLFNNAELEEFLYSIIFDSEEWKLLDQGKITRALAERRMLEAAGQHHYEAQLVLDDWRELMITKLDTVDLILALRHSGHHLYFLSNIPEDVYLLFQQRRRFMQLFEGGVPSFAAKTAKPDPEIFKLLLNTYELSAAETIFIDDSPINVAAAEALGITGLRFKSATALHHDLIELGLPVPIKVKRRFNPEGEPRRPQPKQGDTKKSFFSWRNKKPVVSTKEPQATMPAETETEATPVVHEHKVEPQNPTRRRPATGVRKTGSDPVADIAKQRAKAAAASAQKKRSTAKRAPTKRKAPAKKAEQPKEKKEV
ncbi:MAG: hypothetical protein PWQ08_629 [Clostridiales bacterium]|nr:hypothetical protein [Clostridiales bacterium]